MTHFLSLKNKVLIFLFCCAVIIGPAYTTFDHFDFSHSRDTKSYMKMAEGDFEVDIIHRYRVIVPFLAAAINAPVSYVHTLIWPERDNKKEGLRMSFFIVNTLITSLAGLFIFFICLEYGASFTASLFALIAFLVGSWTSYMAGLPLTDSLYILVVVLTVYGIKAQSRYALLFAIFVGPFAKESFLFIAPLIVLFGRDTLPLKFQIPLFLLSGLLVFSARYYIDVIMATPLDAQVMDAFRQVNKIPAIVKELLSLRGVGELFRTWGIFTFILFIGFTGGRTVIKRWMSELDAVCTGLLIAVLVHILLSGDAGRMLFLASPVFVVSIALIFDRHPFFQQFRSLFFSGRN